VCKLVSLAAFLLILTGVSALTVNSNFVRAAEVRAVSADADKGLAMQFSNLTSFVGDLVYFVMVNSRFFANTRINVTAMNTSGRIAVGISGTCVLLKR
jgi:hypothetical protein